MYMLIPLVLVVLVLGCKSYAKTQTATLNPNLPDFVMNPIQQEDVLYGIGSAKLSTLNQSMTIAEARARQSLAFQLSTNVQAMITDYARDAGTVNNTASLQLAEQVGRQLTQTTLTGAIPVKREQTPDGTFWVLVSLNKDEAARAAAGVIDNEAARYAEFKAMDALKLMDQQLSKTTTLPQVVNQE
jgi:hypothetical protein